MLSGRTPGKMDVVSVAWGICCPWASHPQVSWCQEGGLPSVLLRVPPGWIGDSRPSLLGGNSPVAQAEDSSTRAFRKGRTARTPPLYAPTPKSCCSRQPLPRLCRGICSSPSLCLSPAHPCRREPVGSCLEPQGEPGHLSPLSHLVVAKASGGGAGENKEALSQLWYLLLDALVPHKAGGGLQSSPQPAPGSQDHQGFFLSDNQSGEQSHLPPVSASPQPEAPAQPPSPFHVLPNLPHLGRGLPSPLMRGEDSLSRLSDRGPCLLPPPGSSEPEWGLSPGVDTGQPNGVSHRSSRGLAGLQLLGQRGQG